MLELCKNTIVVLRDSFNGHLAILFLRISSSFKYQHAYEPYTQSSISIVPSLGVHIILYSCVITLPLKKLVPPGAGLSEG